MTPLKLGVQTCTSCKASRVSQQLYTACMIKSKQQGPSYLGFAQQNRRRHSSSTCRVAAETETLTQPATEQQTADAQPQEAAAAVKKRVLSGVQPTGSLHLGNYLGAMRNWVGLQDLYETYFCVVDLHAITLPHSPQELRDSTRSAAALYLACGINPSKAAVFVQSHVPAHSELMWLLNCYTPVGWLKKMIQFKEKSKTAGAEEVGTGLLTYPVLMAADILLYQSDLVPVGEDQRQHLELSRDIAERFNYLFGGKKWKKLGGRGGRIFKVPDAFIPPMGARVMSLTDGTKKMSKSAESDLSRINLLDPPDVVANKIKRAKTDTLDGLEISNAERPEAKNLLTIYSLVSGMSEEMAEEECRNMRWGQFKPLLTDAVVEHLRPIQDKYHQVVQDEAYLEQVLGQGAEQASTIAERTLANCREAMGYMPKKRPAV